MHPVHFFACMYEVKKKKGSKGKKSKKSKKSKPEKKKKSDKPEKSPKKETEAQKNKRIEKERKEKEAQEERDKKKEKQEALSKGKKVSTLDLIKFSLLSFPYINTSIQLSQSSSQLEICTTRLFQVQALAGHAGACIPEREDLGHGLQNGEAPESALASCVVGQVHDMVGPYHLDFGKYS